MARRSLVAAAAVTLAASVAVSVADLPRTSGAVFTSSTRSAATVRAAADWTPPTVAVTAPAGAVSGAVPVAVQASDGETGIRQVVLQTRPVGGSWSPVCTDTTSPYSCTWDTTTVADGKHELRATATDGTGLTATSAPVTATVANAVEVVLAGVGDDVRGTVPLTATLQGGTAAYTVRFEYNDAAGGPWRTVCTDATAPYTCSWNTAGVADGTYDLRAVAVSGSVQATSAVVADVQVDNTAPTVALVNPGTPLRGAVAFTANADDEGSGVDRVTVQYAATGGTTWRDLCAIGEEPWSCTYATTQLADGSYSFRAVATDLVGNTTTSAAVTQRVVDNTVASVSVDDPGTYLRGTVTLTASANSSAGVASVRIQRAATGSSAWTDLCTDSTAPYACTWNTTTVAAGSYDLRAVLVDKAGRTTTSAVLTGRRVDNSPLRAVDVQVANGGKLGKVDSGDTVTFTFGQEADPATITAGWTGAPLAVTARLRDGWLVGTSGRNDILDVSAGRSPVNLGFVALRENYVSTLRTTSFDAVLTARTVVVDGVPVTQVTLALGRTTSGSVRTVTRSATMAWYPSAAVTDRSGSACSAAPATESGSADRDF